MQVRDINEPIHFCDRPDEALCGRHLGTNDFTLFYTNTTSTFREVTCRKCRDKIRQNKLAPGGFPDPAEWSKQ